MKKSCGLLAMAVCLSGAAAAHADFSDNFQGAGALTGWAVVNNSGTAGLSTAQAKAGETQSLYLGFEDSAKFNMGSEQFGTLTMWVYDPSTTQPQQVSPPTTPPTYNGDNGPRWGAKDMNSLDFTDSLESRTYASPSYYYYDTTDTGNNMFTGAEEGPRLDDGSWHEYQFIRTSAGTMSMDIDGVPAGFQPPAWAGADSADGIQTVYIYGGGGYGSNDTSYSGVYVTDVSFTSVPEPASLSLLGLAAGGMLLRRRRRA